MISKDTIRQYIIETLLDNSVDSIDDGEDLLISGLLDSLNVMKLAGHLEQECNFSIPAGDIILENFSTLESINGYVQARAAQAG